MSLLISQLVPHVISVDEIYLDPNNPRFLRDSPTEEERIKEQRIQDSTLEKMQEFNISELKENIRSVGFLEIDRIVVRPLQGGGYVVLEGNRRIAALKILLNEHYNEGRTISPEILTTIEKVNALVYEGSDREAAWFYQGLRSISGIRDWPAYQKGKFIADRIESQHINLSQVAKSFAITPRQAGIWYRSYKAFQQLREHEEYGREFTYDKFAYLAEAVFITKCNALRSWLGWDESQLRFTNEQNVTRFLELFSPEEEGQPARLTRTIDLRDDVCKWASEDLALFERFISGSHTVDQVRQEYNQHQAEDRAEIRVGLAEHLESMRELLTRLPRIPLVEAHERREEVLQLYKRIIDAAQRVIELLGSPSG